MKYQADITTYLLNPDEKNVFFVNNTKTDFAAILKASDLSTLRLSFFSEDSALLPIGKSLQILKQVKQSNSSLYLCVHCSDSWADPSHQVVPASWSFSNKNELMKVFLEYLESIFGQVKNTGVEVKIVQVGNEISNGLLWPHLTKPYEYVNFIKAAHALSRHYFPQAQIVLHTDLSYSFKKALDWYGFMEKRKVDYDLVGLSYYPAWHGDFARLSKTMREAFALTSKKIILSEVGYMNTEQKTSAWFGEWKCDNIRYSPEGQKTYLNRLKQFSLDHAQILHSDLFYWGMFSSNHPDHFPIALFNNQGHALPAFFELNN
jgi:arabinogalactan endo-1,4-beta-galactosidase